MLEPLRDVLEVIVTLAIIVTVFGLLTRSELRAARLFGWFLMSWAVAIAIIEGYDWYLKGDWIITPTQEVWYQIDRESLNALEAAVTAYFSYTAWSFVGWLLEWPAWLVLGISSLLLLVVDHVQMIRWHKGTPPPPLWKRIARALREAMRPDEAEV